MFKDNHDTYTFVIRNSEAAWVRTSFRLPPDEMEVATKIDDENGCRNEQTLVYYKGLWWLPDMSMHVYYTPTHWNFI